MEHNLTVRRLFEAKRERLSLEWVCGDLDRQIAISDAASSAADIVGHLNLIHGERIQVLGSPEVTWAARQNPEKVLHHVHDIIMARPPAIIVADGAPVTDVILSECKNSGTALLTTPQSAALIIDALRLYLSREFAEKIMLHGVLMDVLGIGVLITGDSGVGKSELALELITRGAGLVADDVVEVSRISPEALEGRAPEMLQDFLEVRGLGLLNIRTVFGETSCRRRIRMRLIAHLQRPQSGVPQAARLPLDAQNENILGVPVRKVTIPVAAGRNLAVLVEAAVRSTVLQLRGIDCMQEFLERQQRALESSADNSGAQ
jgi:HPr kinase/phosphorylase